MKKQAIQNVEKKRKSLENNEINEDKEFDEKNMGENVLINIPKTIKI